MVVKRSARGSARALGFALLLLAAGCSPPRISVPEIDRRSYPDITAFEKGTPAEDVIRRLGSPSQRKVLPTHEVWAYAIRCCNWGGWGVPAVHLWLRFDEAGVLADWSYWDPLGERPLAVSESMAQARAVERGFCRVPPAVDIASLMRVGTTTRSDVEQALAVPPAANQAWDFGVVPRKRAVAGGEEWTYDADRPSPLFFRPFYYVIEVENGRVRLAFPAGYGGCK